MNRELLAKAKSLGFSDRQIGHLTGKSEAAVRALRAQLGLAPSYRLVDTCAAEFEAYTPYYYSTYDCGDDETKGGDKRKVMILGGGPNRIGQGIEFDYCCVQAAFAMKELGLESVMINSNPETVSTDYDTSDLLFFEPLTHEDILNVCERLNGGPFRDGPHPNPPLFEPEPQSRRPEYRGRGKKGSEFSLRSLHAQR